MLLMGFSVLCLKEFLSLAIASGSLNVPVKIDTTLDLLAAILLFGGFFLHNEDEGWLRYVFQGSVFVFVAAIYASLICRLIGYFAGYQSLLLFFKWWLSVFLASTLIYILRQRPIHQMCFFAAYGLWLALLWLTHLSEYARNNIQLGLYLALSFVVFKNLMDYFYQLLDNNRRYIKEKETTLSFLEKINTALHHSSFNLEEVLKMIMSCIMASSQAEAGAIFLLSRDKSYLSVEVVEGLFPPLHKSSSDYVDTKAKYIIEKFKTDKIQVGEGIVGEVALKGKSTLIKNALRDSRTPEVGSSFIKIRTMIVSPLKIKDDIVGVIALVNKKDGGQFDEIDDSLLRALGSQAAVSINNARLYRELSEKEMMERELQIAKDIQRLLLPEEPPQLDGVDLAAFCQSAKEVGGDYYDFIRIDEHRLGIVIADVSGKGVPGALVMTMFRSTLQTAAQGEVSARSTLVEVNRLISDSIKSDMFISGFYAILDLKDKTLNFCRAGHDPLILAHQDNKQSCEFLSPGGICLGLVGKDLFEENLEERTKQLQPGDTLVLYTDGATEAMDKNKKEFGFDNLVKAVVNNSAKDAKPMLDSIISQINQFVGEAEQHDDLTMVVVKIK